MRSKRITITLITICFLLSIMFLPATLLAQNNDNSNNNDTNNNTDDNDNDNDWSNDNGNDGWENNWNNDNDNEDTDNDNSNDDDGWGDVDNLITDDTDSEGDEFTDEDVGYDDPLIIGGDMSLQIPVLFAEPGENYDTIFDNTTIFGTPLSGGISFNYRPSDIIRGYFDMELSYTPRYYDGILTNDWVPSEFKIELDELFLDINANLYAFFRLGKQHIKWGTGVRWNPTDFINTERKDPLEPDTERNGVTGIDISVPLWRFNLRTFLGLESLKNILDTSLTFNAKFKYKTFTTSLSANVERGKVPLYGYDIWYGAEFWGGTWEFIGEMSFSMGTNKKLVTYDDSRPGLSEAEIIAIMSDPTLVTDEQRQEALQEYMNENNKFYAYSPSLDKPYFNIVGGITYTPNNPPEWLAEMLTINIEYYFNGEGYHSPDKETGLNLVPYSYLAGLTQETGRHYGGISILMTELFTLEDLSFNANYLLNFSDLSSMLFVSFSYSGIKYLSFSVYAKANFGKPGTEFYFASPVTAGSFISKLLPDFENMADLDPAVIDFWFGDQLIYDDFYDEGVLREILTIGIRMSVSF